jgi:hypothetical protein
MRQLEFNGAASDLINQSIHMQALGDGEDLSMGDEAERGKRKEEQLRARFGKELVHVHGALHTTLKDRSLPSPACICERLGAGMRPH